MTNGEFAELFLLALLPFLAASLLGLVSSVAGSTGECGRPTCAWEWEALIAVVSFTAIANYRLRRPGAGPIRRL